MNAIKLKNAQSPIAIASNTPMYDEGLDELQLTFNSYEDVMQNATDLGMPLPVQYLR